MIFNSLGCTIDGRPLTPWKVSLENPGPTLFGYFHMDTHTRTHYKDKNTDEIWEGFFLHLLGSSLEKKVCFES